MVGVLFNWVFENRFRFTPIEHLPPPEPWKPPPAQPLQTKPQKG